VQAHASFHRQRPPHQQASASPYTLSRRFTAAEYRNSKSQRCKEVDIMAKTYNLFISHSWSYSDAYQKLVNLLDERAYFLYKNYSVPKDDPIHTRGTDKELYAAIKNKVQLSHVVLILAGVYSSYSKWIDKEIEIAKSAFSIPTPIVAIEPWGSERTSATVKENADMIVKWNTESIVDAIRKAAN
jgi:hypothetical protein